MRERERAHGVAVAQFVDFVGNASALFDRIQKARADQQREQEDPMATPPGAPGDPSKEPEPSLELEDDTHIPGGELHTVLPKDPDPEELDPRGEGLRLKHPVATDGRGVSGSPTATSAGREPAHRHRIR